MARPALGEPSSEVYDDGPGWVQHFTAPSSVPAADTAGGEAVICAGHGRPAVAVTAELWDAIRAAGGAGQLATVGYPVITAGTAPLLSTDVDVVLLDGGDWKAGCLVRDTGEGWRWKPQLASTFDVGMTRDWHTAGGDTMDLRLRCAATMRWTDIAGFAIDGDGLLRLRAALREGPLNDVVAALAARFGLDTVGGWERTPRSRATTTAASPATAGWSPAPMAARRSETHRLSPHCPGTAPARMPRRSNPVTSWTRLTCTATSPPRG